MARSAARLDLNRLATLALWQRRFLLATLILAAAAFPLTFAYRYFYYETEVPEAALILVMGVFGLAQYAAYAASVVFTCLWVHCAWSNLYAFGVAALRYSPGWATGSFFVPIVGLFVPFLAMRELYNRSTGEDAHQADTSVGDVTAWWACYVGAWFVQGFIAFRILFNLNGRIYIQADPLAEAGTALLGALLVVGAAFFLRRIVSAITDALQSSSVAAQAFA